MKQNETKRKISLQSGQVAILAALFLLVVSGTAILGIATPIVKQMKITNNLQTSRGSYYLAEAGIEDVIYKLKNGYSVSPSETLSLNGNTATIDITDSGGAKELTAEGDFSSFARKVKTRLNVAVGTSFSYGVQTGQGGFSMDNNAGVVGNVYSNGDITGSSNTYITGSAVAANSAPLTTDQANDSPIPTTNNINFRDASASQDFAQSFQISTTSQINKIDLYIKKTGSPANATVRIVSNNGTNPGTTSLTTGTLSASLVTTNYGWITVTFTSNPLLLEGTTYWIVVDNSTNSATNYYSIGSNNPYANGVAKVGQQGGTWNNTSPSGLDGYFRIYIGGINSTISDVDIGTGSVGNAHAHTVNNSNIAGTLYCQTGTGNNKACNTSLPDPTSQAFPISDANIEQWKTDAEDGGTISGNYTPAGSASNLGPKKIDGNLVLPGDHTLTITGTVWVTGNIIMPNNDTVRLNSGYGTASGVIVSDGYISLENNVNFYGSGSTGSYIMLITTSGCPTTGTCGSHNAIDLGNNIGTDSDRVIVNAQRGTINFSNNAQVKEATAYKIHLSNNVSIEYESGLINVIFASGPGGTWDVSSWKEVE